MPLGPTKSCPEPPCAVRGLPSPESRTPFVAEHVSGGGAENKAERAENRVERSGAWSRRGRKRWSTQREVGARAAGWIGRSDSIRSSSWGSDMKSF